MRLKLLHTPLWSVLALAVFPASLLAQEETTTLRLESRIVLVDVAVTDKAGHPVTDLHREDFKIFEAKTEQRILSFEPPAEHRLPPALEGKLVVTSSADLPQIGSAPVTAIMLDELNMTTDDQRYDQDKLIAWLARQPAVLPQPTSLTAVTYTRTQLLQDYTQERDVLLNTLRHHTAGALWRGNADQSGTYGGVASEKLFTTLGAIEQIAEATHGVAGRKNLIWVGDGFPSVSTAEIGSTGGDSLVHAIQHLTAVLLHAHVTLDIVGPRLRSNGVTNVETEQDEVTASTDFNNSLAKGNVAFESLAAPTGGHAFFNNNDLAAEIGRSVDEGSSYYTLSYRPSESSAKAGTYRKINVEVLRPGLSIVTRDGYFKEEKSAPSPAPVSKEQLGFDLYGAAQSTIPYVGIHVSAEPGKAPGAWTLEAAARDLRWTPQPDGRTLRADTIVLAVCLGARGKILAKQFAELSSDTIATESQLLTMRAPLSVQIAPPPGTQRIRFVVRDMDNGQIGTADAKP